MTRDTIPIEGRIYGSRHVTLHKGLTPCSLRKDLRLRDLYFLFFLTGSHYTNYSKSLFIIIKIFGATPNSYFV